MQEQSIDLLRDEARRLLSLGLGLLHHLQESGVSWLMIRVMSIRRSAKPVSSKRSIISKGNWPRSAN